MRRLLCILDSLSAGGAETFMMKLYHAMDRSLFQMDFVVCKEGIYDEEVRAMGGKIYFIPMRTKNIFAASNGIRKIVKTNGYEVVLKVGSSPIIVTDLLSAKFGGAKRICVRTCNAPVRISYKNKVINWCLRPLMNRLADVKIAPSDLAAAYTFGKKEVERGKVFFLHNAVDLCTYRFDGAERKQIRDMLCISDDTFVIGHIGRFVEQKNHKFLINIFNEILVRNSDAVLLLIGDGELYQDVRKQVKCLGIENYVKFLGIQRNISAWLSAMDVFALPSLHEGMPNTVIEAQATGLPCVVSDTVTRESDITGLVNYVSNSNLNEWVEKIILRQQEKRRDTKKDFIKNKYDIESVTEYFLGIMFGEIVGGNYAKTK